MATRILRVKKHPLFSLYPPLLSYFFTNNLLNSTKILIFANKIEKD